MHTLLLCILLGPCLPTVMHAHLLFQSARVAGLHLRDTGGYEGIQKHNKQQSQKQDRERAEDMEAWTGLRKGRSEWWPQIYPVQPCLDSQHKASFLEDFCSAKVSIKATFIRQQGKTMNKMSRGMLIEEMWWGWSKIKSLQPFSS